MGSGKPVGDGIYWVKDDKMLTSSLGSTKQSVLSPKDEKDRGKYLSNLNKFIVPNS
jgi:hypothetical protein